MRSISNVGHDSCHTFYFNSEFLIHNNVLFKNSLATERDKRFLSFFFLTHSTSSLKQWSLSITLFAFLSIYIILYLPSLLRRIFPTQGSNLSLFHCRWILYHQSYQGGQKNDSNIHQNRNSWLREAELREFSLCSSSDISVMDFDFSYV